VLGDIFVWYVITVFCARHLFWWWKLKIPYDSGTSKFSTCMSRVSYEIWGSHSIVAGISSLGMWHSVSRWVFPDIYKDHCGFDFTSQAVRKILIGLFTPVKVKAKWSFKLWEPITQQHNITSKKTEIWRVSCGCINADLLYVFLKLSIWDDDVSNMNSINFGIFSYRKLTQKDRNHLGVEKEMS
jgi:hypothetical protein